MLLAKQARIAGKKIAANANTVRVASANSSMRQPAAMVARYNYSHLQHSPLLARTVPRDCVQKHESHE